MHFQNLNLRACMQVRILKMRAHARARLLVGQCTLYIMAPCMAMAAMVHRRGAGGAGRTRDDHERHSYRAPTRRRVHMFLVTYRLTQLLNRPAEPSAPPA